uniref:Colicin D immunity protein domain-containing protein n=1 Tax=Eunotia naegelii TaxID=1458866 RepID=A0A023JEJ4_9STRA|nr:hypothetical protein [Eunotia naegelii]AHI51136.1 hypothetical protein [Eunotia naegelii]
MHYNLEKFFKLVKQSDNFRSQNTSMYHEDKTDFFELLSYQIVICNNIFWKERFKFITEMYKFINEEIDAEEFSNEIWGIRNYTMSTIEEFKKDFEKLKNLELDPRAREFSILIDNLCSDADVFEPEANENEPLNEKWLKDRVKNTILKIQKFMKF